MGTIFAEYTSKRNSIVVYTSTMGIFLITMSIPIKMSTFFGNSEHPFPEK